MKSRVLVSTLGSTLAITSVLVACVGGPGQLPSDSEQNPDVEKAAASGSGSSNKNSGSGSSSSTGSSQGSTGSGGAVVDASTIPPVQQQTIAASEFDRSCDTDLDCVPIFQGTVCSPCQCPNGAIAASSQSDYQTKLKERSASCPPQGDVACSPCSATLVPVCSASKQCSLGTKKDAG